MNGIEYINIDVINVVNEQIIFLQSTMPWEVKKINNIREARYEQQLK